MLQRIYLSVPSKKALCY